MMTELRGIVRAAMDELPVNRRPALRRSFDPDALLAADLPLAAEEAVVEQFVARMAEMGVRVRRQEGWLLLDAEIPVPEYAVPAWTDGELGCCMSLLERHAGTQTDARTLRAVAKAAESGRGELERLCATLHGEWARALREHRSIPGGLLPYLYRAENMTKM